MKWYNNLRIPVRLIVSFTIISVFAFIIGVFSIVNSVNLNTSYTSEIADTLGEQSCLTRLRNDFNAIKQIASETILYLNNTDQIEKNKSELEKVYVDTIDTLVAYRNIMIAYGEDPEEEYDPTEAIATIDTIIVDFNEYCDAVRELLEFSKQATFEDMKEKNLEFSQNPFYDTVSGQFDYLYAASIEYMGDVSTANTEFVNRIVIVDVFILVVLIITASLLILPLSRSIRIPINKLVISAKEIANGNLDLDLRTNRRDEIGILSNQFAIMIETLSGIIGDINTMAIEQSKGDLDYLIDTKKYLGGYKKVASGINNMVQETNAENQEVIKCLNSYAEGNFEANIKQLPGKKSVSNQAINLLQKNLKQINDEVNLLIGHFLEGNLSTAIDSEKYDGDWAKLTQGLNKLVKTVVVPIKECKAVLSDTSKGNLKSKMTSDYKGEFSELKQMLNNTVDSLNGYIINISEIMAKLSNDDYNVEIDMDYAGDFLPIKQELTIVINRINAVISEIGSSADQVADGAKQISEGSMSLAQGASTQSASVEELLATVSQILAGTTNNVKVAKQANLLAANMEQDAAKGKTSMNNMLNAMNEINDSSSNIAKIIKVIDDIAFQTNLLALNAAVEAARAGIHGKGFAVVAEEVRTLAARSKVAASDTSALIESSITKVSDGMKISHETATALENIVGGITSIAGLVSNIETSSIVQAQSIEHVNIGIGQISMVTQTNTSLSEEQSAFAQELSSQSETLRSMVGKFKIKTRV